MKVTLRLLATSEPLRFDVSNTYTKGGMYCLRTPEGTLKFPLVNIFSSLESDGYTSQAPTGQMKPALEPVG